MKKQLHKIGICQTYSDEKMYFIDYGYRTNDNNCNTYFLDDLSYQGSASLKRGEITLVDIFGYYFYIKLRKNLNIKTHIIIQNVLFYKFYKYRFDKLELTRKILLVFKDIFIIYLI